MKQIDWKTVWKKIGVAAGACVALITLVCGVVASLCTKELLGIETGKKIIAGIILILFFGFSRSTAMKFPCKRLLLAALNAGVIMCALIIMKSFLFQGMKTSLLLITLSLLSSLIAGMAASSKKGRAR